MFGGPLTSKVFAVATGSGSPNCLAMAAAWALSASVNGLSVEGLAAGGALREPVLDFLPSSTGLGLVVDLILDLAVHC